MVTIDNFFMGLDPMELVKEYGSPLYVYNEKTLRARASEMAGLLELDRFTANFSTKANSNLELLKIVREEGMHADAMSPGEILVLLAAGFKPEDIFFVSNNVSVDEMAYAVDKGVLVSVDSLDQLELFGANFPGHDVAVRFNPGIGAGHHEKVVTAGKKTKFGVNTELLPEVKELCHTHDLNLVGINQHIGSLFLTPDQYVSASANLLSVAKQISGLKFVDFGGGFGIPYNKSGNQKRLDLESTRAALTDLIMDFEAESGLELEYRTEPGRYVCAECGTLLGTVYAVKDSWDTTYVGTDLGFNVLARPVMYNSFHEIKVFSSGSGEQIKATIVGNICESGDILAKDREVARPKVGDTVAAFDAGAYGFSMASNYNNRLRPAEVLIQEDGTTRLIRRRETLEDLMNCF